MLLYHSGMGVLACADGKNGCKIELPCGLLLPSRRCSSVEKNLYDIQPASH